MTRDTMLKIAKVIRRMTVTAWNLSIASASKYSDDVYNRMKRPAIGDCVVELTTVSGWRDETPNDIDAVGALLEIVNEPMRQGRSGDQTTEDQPLIEWDETTDGPRPTELVYYIRTLDGRRFRWANASMIAVPVWLQEELRDRS